MDTSIPLMGQPIDFVGSMTRGVGAAQMQNQANRENALAALYQQQGPQIASGDPAALNALAALDPNAALGVQQTRQGMAGDAERLRLAREAGQREAQRMAAQATAEQVAAEAEKGRNLILQGTAMYEAWTAGDQGAGLALNAMLQQHGIQGNAQSFPQIMAVTAGALDTFSTLQGMRPKAPDPLKGAPANMMWNQPGNPAAGVKPIPGYTAPQTGPKWRAATPEEAAQYGAAGGQIDETTGKFDAFNPPSSGITIRNADGSTTQIGGPAKPVADAGQFTSPAAMISSIEGILNDPALDKSVGAFSILQNVPGTPQRGFKARADQLQGQAFLQAFNSLRGAGQITEIEGAKATAAIGRLDTAQSAADYRAALTELKGILEAAQGRASGAASGIAADAQAAGAIPQIGAGGEGYDQLKPGDKYRAPDGNIYVRQ